MPRPWWPPWATSRNSGVHASSAPAWARAKLKFHRRQDQPWGLGHITKRSDEYLRTLLIQGREVRRHERRQTQRPHQPLAGAAQGPCRRSGQRAANKAQRRKRNAGQFVKRASFTRSVKETGARGPRARERAAVVIPAGNTGLIVLCVKDGCPTGARRRPWVRGPTGSATARPRSAGTRPSAVHQALSADAVATLNPNDCFAAARLSTRPTRPDPLLSSAVLTRATAMQRLPVFAEDTLRGDATRP